jgi:hypothetical protein
VLRERKSNLSHADILLLAGKGHGCAISMMVGAAAQQVCWVWGTNGFSPPPKNVGWLISGYVDRLFFSLLTYVIR